MWAWPTLDQAPRASVVCMSDHSQSMQLSEKPQWWCWSLYYLPRMRVWIRGVQGTFVQDIQGTNINTALLRQGARFGSMMVKSCTCRLGSYKHTSNPVPESMCANRALLFAWLPGRGRIARSPVTTQVLQVYNNHHDLPDDRLRKRLLFGHVKGCRPQIVLGLMSMVLQCVITNCVA